MEIKARGRFTKMHRGLKSCMIKLTNVLWWTQKRYSVVFSLVLKFISISFASSCHVLLIICSLHSQCILEKCTMQNAANVKFSLGQQRVTFVEKKRQCDISLIINRSIFTLPRYSFSISWKHTNKNKYSNHFVSQNGGFQAWGWLYQRRLA